MKKRFIGLAVGILLVLVLGFFAYWQLRPEYLPVSKPKLGDLVEAVYGFGVVTSARTFQLKVGVSTTITDIFVREGANRKNFFGYVD